MAPQTAFALLGIVTNVIVGRGWPVDLEIRSQHTTSMSDAGRNCDIAKSYQYQRYANLAHHAIRILNYNRKRQIGIRHAGHITFQTHNKASAQRGHISPGEL